MSIVCTGGGKCARTWTMLSPEEGQQELSCPECGARYVLIDGDWTWVGKAQVRWFELAELDDDALEAMSKIIKENF